jgi:hypothetical protein
MSKTIITTHIVGVSFISICDEIRGKSLNERDAIEEKLVDAAVTLKLDYAGSCQEVDAAADDFIIGISFDDRPTDKQVEEAKQKVKEFLFKLEQLVGRKADSEVNYWNIVTVC